jgi:phosphomannomutase/phosphoglucomutase
MSAATMLGLSAVRKTPISELIAALPKFTMYQEKRKTSRAKEIVDHMREFFSDCPVDDRDGIRITKGGAWALIRPSGTEPLVRVYTESRDAEEAKEMLDTILNEIAPYLS